MSHPALMLLEEVAGELEWLEPRPVYVGGVAIVVHLRGAVLEHHHATDDVDVLAAAVTSQAGWYVLESTLRAQGWRNDLVDDAPLCRFVSPSGHRVDFMPVDPSILGFSNPWYEEVLAAARDATLPSGRVVRVAEPGPLLATKLEAYAGRGADDPLVSGDLDHRQPLHWVPASPGLGSRVVRGARRYVGQAVAAILADERASEAIVYNLLADDPDGSTGDAVLSLLGELARVE